MKYKKVSSYIIKKTNNKILHLKIYILLIKPEDQSTFKKNSKIIIFYTLLLKMPLFNNNINHFLLDFPLLELII